MTDTYTTNKLLYQKSPYLLQHAYNPIRWYPWGQEAFDKANREDKPIFLSIGYSTCRWCHNMNRESFQDREVAEILNEYYVAIKVDREERPDIDKVYMTCAEILIGSAGWPLNLLLTPDKKPFFAGTYFPKKTENGMMGLIDLLHKMNRMWHENKESVLSDSNCILQKVEQLYSSQPKRKISEDIYGEIKKELIEIFDHVNGGFGHKPKFPLPQYILFLLKYADQINDQESLNIAKTTLKSMYKGGIFDHVGFGFYRYSTDEKWLLPHFEKMLYDNALLAIAYIKAYQITKQYIYKEVADKIFDFLLRDMLGAEKAFYSALDAETKGEEGRFYTFKYDEVLDVVGKEYGRFYCDYYDISKDGNFNGRNIPNLIGKSLSNTDKDKDGLDSARNKLFYYRETKTKPHRDEKIITSWNGLIISALAYGGKVFNNKIYIDKAKQAADFIIANNIDEDGNLLSIHINGESYNFGLLEDYSFFIYGLLNLYEVTKDNIYLGIGFKLTDRMMEQFWDNSGGLYHYSNISEQLILRLKDNYDGAIPSGNAFVLLSLQKLYSITKDENILEKYNKILSAFGETLSKNPTAHIYSILSFMNMNS